MLAYLPLACSTDDGSNKVLPGPPPSGGSASGGSGTSGNTAGGDATSGGSAGTATGGGGGAGGMMSSGCGGSMAASVLPNAACTMTCQCPVGGFKCDVKTHVCDCAADVPDTCGTGAAAICTMKVTDPNNCGACDTKCDAGAACVAGKCGTKPTDLTTATGCGGGVRMATDGKALYWTETATGKVRSMPIAGGTVTDVATAQKKPTQIAVNASGVYWTNAGDGTAGTSTVMKMPLPVAGAPVPLATSAGTESILNVTLDAANVYYALKTDVHQVKLTADNKVMTDLVVGTAVNYDDPKNPIVSGEPTGLAVNATVALWTTGTRSGVELHTLNAVDVASGAGYNKLAKSVGALLFNGDVGIDATNGYWADGEKMELNGLTDTTFAYKIFAVEPHTSHITAFAINATNVYAGAEDGHIFKRSLVPPADSTMDPTPPVLVARDQMNVSSVVLDAAHVYWVTEDCMIRSSAL